MDKLVLEKLVKNESITLDEALDFIDDTMKVISPNKDYKRETTVQAFQVGMGEQILKSCFSIIMENPKPFGVEIDILKNLKTNEILKVIVK